MAGSFSSVNLAKLPLPNIVEQIDVEDIIADMIAMLRILDPNFTALVESDPAYKQIELFANREMLLRQWANEQAKGVMLAYAIGSDLDQIAARYNVERLTLAPADDTAIPPTLAVMESDDDLRRRTQLSFEGLSAAGPAGAYISHALAADPDVADCAAVSPTPGVVEVYVLSRTGTGVPAPSVLANVAAALNDEEVRPLTDSVSVLPVDVVNYTVEATLTVLDGPDAEVVRQTSQAAAEAYVTAQRKIGLPATRAGLYAALCGAGVLNVALSQPAADVDVTAQQVAVCTGVSVSLA